LAIDFSCQA